MAKNELTNMDIVLYALYELEGATRKIFTEDIALKCFKYVPSRFSWIIYPKYPDLEPVRKALFEARSQRHHNLIHGRHGKTSDNQVADGWIFTPQGINWVLNNKDRIISYLNLSPVKNRTIISRQILAIKKSQAYEKYKKTNNIDGILPYEFTDLLNASLDTPKSTLRDRLNQMLAIAAEAQERDVVDFFHLAEKHFSKLLGV